MALIGRECTRLHPQRDPAEPEAVDLVALQLAHAASTWYMVGVIWFVQLVHYALFPAIGREAVPAYQAANLRRTSWVVIPGMAVEGTTTLALLALRGDWLSWTGAILLAAVWASTAFLQVPCHGRLERSFDAAIARRLVTSNWLRTAAWSMRGAVALALLVPLGPAS